MPTPTPTARNPAEGKPGSAAATPNAAPIPGAAPGAGSAGAKRGQPGKGGPQAGPQKPKPGSEEGVREELKGKDYEQGAQYVKPGGELTMSGADAKKQAADAGKQEGPGTDLPYRAQIEKAFGTHSLSGVRAYVGGEAGKTAEQMGAPAFTQGDKVVFQKKPDLHMAAHEAAHLIQQRQGRLPPGGKSAPGDPLEREADAVADRVVAGQSAADLLGSKKEGGEKSDAVQAYAGNVDTATTSGPGTVREQVDRNFSGGPAGDRDDNFNPAVKVEFEGKLGIALLRAQAFYRPVVENVSYGVYRYLQAKAEVLKEDEKKLMEQAFESFSFMYDAFEPGKQAGGVFYGRIRDNMADKADYFGAMTDLLLNGSGTVQNHMLAHQCFLDKVLDAAKDASKGVGGTAPAAQYLDQMRKTAAERKAEKDAQLADAQAPDLKHLRKTDAGEADPFGERGKGVSGREARGRLDMRKGFNPGKGGFDPAGPLPDGVKFDNRMRDGSKVPHSQGIADDDSPQQMPADGERLGLGQVHSRGVETYTLDESQTFIQQARTTFNMPLAAGISGTTTDLHEVAKMFGVQSPEQQFKYQLACLAHLGTAGAHSFHEIMAAAALNTGVTYEPGNYRSILKYGVEAIAEIKALFDDPKYAEIPGIGDPAKLRGKTSEAPADKVAAASPPPPPAPNPAAAPAPAAVA
ncbi:MAG: DUF4157 domain-containing protein [Deltaproteobacteria bacterium]|nr:DUF4157 domain-containing protein [Deltaproteobacteria bacterium]